jgi:hypothetical protein
MSTRHTPKWTDTSDPKKAVRQLSGSMDDAYLLLNRIESKMDVLKFAVRSNASAIAAASTVTPAPVPIPPTPPGIDDLAWAWFNG